MDCMVSYLRAKANATICICEWKLTDEISPEVDISGEEAIFKISSEEAPLGEGNGDMEGIEAPSIEPLEEHGGVGFVVELGGEDFLEVDCFIIHLFNKAVSGA